MPREALPPRGHTGALPWVRLRSAASGPLLYRRMVGDVDPKAGAGNVVAVYDKGDAPYGIALYNPKSLVALRMLDRGTVTFHAEAFFEERLAQAAGLRRDILRLDAATDAYRVVYGEGDGLPGLVVDRYADALVCEYYSLGMFQRRDVVANLLVRLFPGTTVVHRAAQPVETLEGFRCDPAPARSVLVKENGVRFRVDLGGGYKTGFFCDQRDNRLAFSALTAGRTVLDVCSYTGGFGIYGKHLGGAGAVTCVDLDPEAVAMAGKNAGLNQVKVETAQADAFPYLRQAADNKRAWDAVVLDPWKLIGSREGFREGRQKYYDLNRLAMAVVAPGGLLVTCSCSGLLGWEEFTNLIRGAAARAGRRLQILRRSGAGPDHPVALDFPEGEYLKVLWCRVLSS